MPISDWAGVGWGQVWGAFPWGGVPANAGIGELLADDAYAFPLLKINTPTAVPLVMTDGPYTITEHPWPLR